MTSTSDRASFPVWSLVARRSSGHEVPARRKVDRHEASMENSEARRDRDRRRDRPRGARTGTGAGNAPHRVVSFLSGQAAESFGIPAVNAAKLLVETFNAGQAPAPYDK